MLFRRLSKTLIGFLTCTIVVIVLLLLLFPTIPAESGLSQLHEQILTDYGKGHFWVILLMLCVVNIFLPISIPSPIPEIIDTNITNNYGNLGLYFLVLFIWLVGAFAGGLASRGGLRSGFWSALLSFLFLDLIFASITASMFSSIAGLSGFVLFLAVFFFTLVIGSFVFVPIIGLIGGIVGGILGKMLFRGKKDKSIETDEE